MTGTPTAGEVQAQIQNSVALLESARVWVDDSVMSYSGSTGAIEAILEDIEGEYTPALAPATDAFRALCSSLLSGSTASSLLLPVMREYGRLVDAGAAYTDTPTLMRAIFEHFHNNSITVKSRNITFDTSATTGDSYGGSIVGNGSMYRLTVDDLGYDIEDCSVENKLWRCRLDQNNGGREHAEVFECQGDAASTDWTIRGETGSGITGTTITAKHAGTGDGGSLLQNSSFTTYDSGGSPKFAGWTETSGSANIAQDTSTTYRGTPAIDETDASLRLNGDATVTQPLSAMRTRSLVPGVPYYCRLMVNETAGSASGGTLTLTCGSQTASGTVGSIGSGWQEIAITLNENMFGANLNADPFTVAISWASSSSGYLLIDDVIFVPMDQVDGTWWALIGGTTPFLQNDTLKFTDTGGNPEDAKVQWWLRTAGLGYLPSTTGTPTITDPA